MSEKIKIEDVGAYMGELRLVAQRLLRCEADADSVRPTALVISALRRNKNQNQDWSEVSWKNRQYFFGAMHQAMRRSLIDRAKKKAAKKRPPLKFVEPEDLNFYDLEATLENAPDQIDALTSALGWLEGQDPNLAQIVEYRFFSGLTVGQTAKVMNVSEKTIKRRWSQAKLLLYDRILGILNEAA